MKFNLIEINIKIPKLPDIKGDSKIKYKLIDKVTKEEYDFSGIADAGRRYVALGTERTTLMAYLKDYKTIYDEEKGEWSEWKKLVSLKQDT